MATITNYAHGQFSWVDLMSLDMQQAKSFYGELFGWNAVDQDTQGGPPYSIFKLNDDQLAGLGQMSDEMKASGMPPCWHSYVNVDDIDAATNKAVELGGTVTMPPMQVLDAGKMSIIQDPTGAHLSLWQKINHGGAMLVNVPNTWSWNEVVTPEPDRTISFYRDLFGWTFEVEEGSEVPYWTIKNGERLNGGMLQRPPEMSEIPPYWSVYFSVEDINQSTEKLKSLGGTLLRGPFEVSVGHISVVADSQGAAFQIVQLTVPADD